MSADVIILPVIRVETPGNNATVALSVRMSERTLGRLRKVADEWSMPIGDALAPARRR